MNVGPHKKKDWAAKDVPSDMPGGIHFTPELIARVATFSEAIARPGRVGASDVKNICLAVGPVTSRIIKLVYLKKNMRYLEKVVQIFADRDRDAIAEWARECHLAWMSVNTGWRSLVTDELMERYERFRSNHSEDYMCASPPNIHPLLALVNPTVAIEMDLLEALKHLVEVKGIDINATRWVGLKQLSSFRFHLIATAIRVDNYDAFQYLMSADAIDIYSMNRDYASFDSSIKESIFSYAIDEYIDDENKKRYFDAFVKHSKFRPNGRLFTGYEPNPGVPVTCLHYVLQILFMKVLGTDAERVVDVVKYLLDAGADPKLGFHGFASPLKSAVYYRANAAYRAGPWLADALSKIIEIMSEHRNS